MFYTFLGTKHQEENTNNDQLLPQEIEIRPITRFPWHISKTLSPHEVWYKGELQLPMEYIQATILRHIPDLMSKTHMMIGHFDLKVKDIDTNTIHTVSFWKGIHDDNFATGETWIKEFVKRRSLVAGMVVGVYWDFNANMLCFSVLEWRVRVSILIQNDICWRSLLYSTKRLWHINQFICFTLGRYGDSKINFINYVELVFFYEF